MSRLAIEVENISKQYVLGSEASGQKTFREMLSGAIKEPIKRLQRLKGSSSQQERFWALKEVSFSVNEGEVVGIIGSNGAGKSTLLKILSRITAPTSGEIRYRGRIASLLEVGTGFHPELSGRENIYINGAILGMTKRDIRQRFDEIVEFAGVEKFLDTPVKRYSSGMYVRLAFAVAAHLDPDILVVDEVLAVGDAAFQKKCLGKMKDVSCDGRTVILVSHNISMIQSLCSTVAFLDSGRLLNKGETSGVIDTYISGMSQPMSEGEGWSGPRPGNGWVRATNIKLHRKEKEVDTVQMGQDVEFIISYELNRQLSDVGFRIEITTIMGEMIYWFSTDYSNTSIRVSGKTGSVICYLPNLSLMPGSYSVNIVCGAEGQLSDRVDKAMKFDVADGDYFGGGKIPPLGTVHVVAPQTWMALGIK